MMPEGTIYVPRSDDERHALARVAALTLDELCRGDPELACQMCKAVGRNEPDLLPEGACLVCECGHVVRWL